MATHAEAMTEVQVILEKLDSLASEDHIAGGFLGERLITGSESAGYSVDLGTIYYTLEELGERRLALDLEEWYDSTQRA